MQSKSVGIEELVPVISEAVKSGAEINFTPKGHSMLPFISYKDNVFLEQVPEKLKKYDIALYYRKSTGTYVMHRLINIKDGNYVFCGDNQCYEEYGIDHDDIVAVVSSVVCGGKEKMCGFGYAVYCRTLFLRRFAKKVKGRLCRGIFKNKR